MAKNISDMQGLKPQLREYLALQAKAMSGDIVMVLTPSTTGSPATDATAFTRDVVITLETASGDIHTWANAAYETSLAATEAVAGALTGDVTIASTTLTFVEGSATVTVSATGGWAIGDTNTLTASAVVIAGLSVPGGTSIDTIVAA